MNYRDFEIETFELGRGLWHARYRRADKKPTLIDGIEFDHLHGRIACSSSEDAFVEAQNCIDGINRVGRS